MAVAMRSPLWVKRPPRATARGRPAEDTMKDELTARQRAIHLRLAGRSVQYVCWVLGCGKAWFCESWAA